MPKYRRFRYFARVVIVAGLTGLLVCGCGGSGSSNPPGPPQFTIASGNWIIPITGGALAGGALTQTGNTISGMLHVIGSPCFDPVANTLTVNGTVSTDPQAQNALSLSTAPVRGQTLGLTATWVAEKAQTAPPPTKPDNPTAFLAGTSTVSGGSCAGSDGGGATFVDFNGTWVGLLDGPTWTANVTFTISQTGPDAQGFFHVSGNVAVSGSPCFTSGTIAASSIAGEMNQITINMDSGQLVGSATRIIQPIQSIMTSLTNSISFNFTVQGGSCNGETVTTAELTSS